MKHRFPFFLLFVIALFPVYANNELLVGDMGVTVSVNENGGAVASIPIEVPAGINGMQPNLSLVYNSQGGYGIAGWGWDLAGISRITRTGSTFYHDGKIAGIQYFDSDNFALDGQRLLLKSGLSGQEYSTYRTEIESFNLATYLSPVGGFEIESKEGTFTTYGDVPMARHKSSFGDVYGWYVHKTVDLNGNYILYSYIYTTNTGEMYPSKVEYTGNQNAPTSPCYSIEFEYENAPFPIFSFNNECLISQTKRLKCIHVKYGTSLLYSYIINYTLGSTTSKVSSLQKIASNGDHLRTTTVTWTNSGNSSNRTNNLSTSRKNCLLYADFNGDGKTDIFTYNTSSTTAILYLNASNNNVLAYTPMTVTLNHTYNDFKAGDYNGDGYMDLLGMYKSGSNYYYTYRLFNGTSFNSVTTNIGNYTRNHFVVGDYNGDGRDECYIQKNDTSGVMYQYGNGNTIVTVRDFWNHSVYSFPTDGISLDFNGNGKTDIAVFKSNTLHYYEFNGTHFKDISNYPLSGLTDANSVDFGDFNGDGNNDIIYPCTINGVKQYIIVYSKASDGTMSSYIEPKDTVSVSNNIFDKVFVCDFNNDGTSDLAYFAEVGSSCLLMIGINSGGTFTFSGQLIEVTKNQLITSKNAFMNAGQYPYLGISFADILGDGRGDFTFFGATNVIKTHCITNANPMLVSRIVDGMGNLHSFTYKPITDNSVYSESVSTYTFPVSRFRQPIYVVSQYTAPYTNLSFTYKNCRIHRQGKGFLGFGERTVIDNLNNRKATTTNSYNGIFYFTYPTKEITSSLQGDTLTTCYYSTSYKSFGGKNIFPYTSQIVHKDYLTTLQSTTSYVYDNWGNQTSCTKTTGNLVERQYAGYGAVGSWCANRLLHSYSYNTLDSENSPIRHAYYSYDTRGNLTREVTDSTTANFKLISSYTYDTFGNRTRALVSGSGQTRTSSSTFTASGRFPTSATDVTGMTTTYQYNDTTGWLMSSTDAVGTTAYTYDTFGRQLGTSYPDGTSSVRSYHCTTGLEYVKYHVTETGTARPPVTTFYNSSGKKLYTETLGLNGNKIYTATAYHTNGQPRYESEPFFGDNIYEVYNREYTSNNATVYTYDGYKRLSSISNPAGTTTYIYNGLSTSVDSPEKIVEKSLNSSGLVRFERWVQRPIPLRTPEISIFKTVNYTYYPTGQLKTATPSGGTAVSMQYDVAGNRTQLVDPDAGTVHTTYNAFGQPVSRSQNVHSSGTVTTSYTYRPTTGLLWTETTAGDTTLTKTYTYDTTFKDKLSQIAYNKNHKETYVYNALGQLYRRHTYVPGKTFSHIYNYTNGLLRKDLYASMAGSMYYTYDTYGNCIAEEYGDQTVWELMEVNARGQVTKERRSGVVTDYTYDNCGRILSIKAPNVISLHYTYDECGNVASKTDSITNQTVDYSYDNKQRLETWTYDDTDEYGMTYDSNTGTITHKSDVGTNSLFAYGAGSKPHALSTVSGIAAQWNTPTITLGYTDFGKLASLHQGNLDYSVSYGMDNHRIKSTFNNGSQTVTRYYTGPFENIIDSLGNIQYFAYFCHGAIVNRVSSTINLLQGYYDAQGSLIALTNSNGTVLRRYAYDPWGKRCNPVDWSQPDTVPMYNYINRGYTGHEHLDEFGLINMNGRVFDPMVAQFLSPDPYIQEMGNWLNYNRYAYCLNNPLKYTDPSGEFAWHILIGGLIGGGVNLYANWGNCQGFWQYAAAFGAGFLSGAATAATGGASTGFLATTGAALGSSFLGGISTAATNNLISQTGTNFSGTINWKEFGLNTISGGVSGLVSYGSSCWATKYFSGAVINGYAIKSPVISRGLIGMVGGAIGGASSGFASGFILSGGDIQFAKKSAWQQMYSGAIVGAGSGAGRGYLLAKQYHLNPWTGELDIKSLDLQPSLDRVNSGNKLGFKHDGTVHHNNKNLLPVQSDGSYYTEYIHPTVGIKGVGAQRIVTGKGGEIYYSPDHYETFIRIK